MVSASVFASGEHLFFCSRLKGVLEVRSEGVGSIVISSYDSFLTSVGLDTTKLVFGNCDLGG